MGGTMLVQNGLLKKFEAAFFTFLSVFFLTLPQLIPSHLAAMTFKK
jgi:hypothetical protein